MKKQTKILLFTSGIRKSGNEVGEIIKEVTGTHQVLVQKPVEAISCMLEGRYFVGGLWNKLFSHRCISGLRFYPELKNNEDILFCAMAFQKADTITFADETKYCYYVHSTSACNQLGTVRQVRDRVRASELMIQHCEKEIQPIVKRWCFNAKSSLFRLLTFTGGSSEELATLKEWLKNNFSNTEGLDIRTKINYFLMFYSGGLYQMIYKVYNHIRKPNWDVK